MIDGFQRRGWDSNPCAREDKRFSRPPRYDHFGTSPYSFCHVCVVAHRWRLVYNITSPATCQQLFSIFSTFLFIRCFLLSHRLFTLFLRILCFLFILRLSLLFALFCFQYTGQFICRLSKIYFHLKYPAETVLILSLSLRIFYSNTVRTARQARSYISCLFPALLPQALCIRTNPFCIPDFWLHWYPYSTTGRVDSDFCSSSSVGM